MLILIFSRGIYYKSVCPRETGPSSLALKGFFLTRSNIVCGLGPYINLITSNISSDEERLHNLKPLKVDLRCATVNSSCHHASVASAMCGTLTVMYDLSMKKKKL